MIGERWRLTLAGVGDVCLARASLSSVPGDDGWLAPAEAAVLAGLRVPKRAADWRLGRWVAKAAVAEALRAWSGAAAPAGASGAADDGAERIPGPGGMEILAGPGGGPRARVLAPGEWPELSVSLSHAGGVGFAAAAVGAWRLGCDVEEIAPRSEAFVSDYFTEAEAAWVRFGGASQALRANLLWSAKESALKALGEGLRKDTLTVVVDLVGLGEAAVGGTARRGGAESLASAAWHPLLVTALDGADFVGSWTADVARVWTVVAAHQRG